ncbi:MAG TPA: O-antigen ligase family protein [Candidatus Polarisedimenticolia bacterium]|nr:O-antigen ligase family protein [Candidatus Polarisedimenticolia bacterium]
MPRGSYVICWAAALLAGLAPLPFGSVGPASSALVQTGVVALALLWVGSRRRAGVSPLPWRDPILWTGAALLGYGLLQIVPLPIGLVEALSPAAAALKSGYSPEPPAWAALSLNPYATWRSCLRIVCWTLAALLVRHNAVDLKGRLVVAGGLVAGGLFQAGYGLFEFISGRQHIFGYAKKHFTDVATGTFISRNNYAGYLEMAIPMALALSLLCLGRLGRSRRAASSGGDSFRRSLEKAAGPRAFKALLFLLAAFVMTVALLMSRSRMGIISIAVALIAGGLLLGLRGKSRRFAVVSVAVAGTAAIFASQIEILPIVNRFHALHYEFGGGYGRYRVWVDAVDLVRSYPLFGSGLGTWEMAFSPFRKDATQVKVDFAHNDYLEFGAEAGAAGVVILVAGAFLALRQRARWRSLGAHEDEIALAAGVGLLALALHSFTDFHLAIPADALTAALLVGLFLRQSGPAPAPAAAAPPRRGGALFPAAVCSLALLGLGAAAVTPAVAQIQAGPAAGARGDEEDPAGRPAETGAGAPDDDLCPGCALDPFNPTRYTDAASRVRRRILSDVEVVVRAQSAGVLPDAHTRVYLAGRIEAGLGLARRAIALSPASGRAHMEAGLLHFGRFALTGLPLQASDDFERARESFSRAMSLQPWRAATHRRIARLVAPFLDQADDSQRDFILRAVRRAAELAPRDPEMARLASEVGA